MNLRLRFCLGGLEPGDAFAQGGNLGAGMFQQGFALIESALCFVCLLLEILCPLEKFLFRLAGDLLAGSEQLLFFRESQLESA